MKLITLNNVNIIILIVRLFRCLLLKYKLLIGPQKDPNYKYIKYLVVSVKSSAYASDRKILKTLHYHH